MHTEHDALPVVAGNGDSSLFVAATLTALALAGSALVYRKIYEHPPAREKLTQPLEHLTSDNMDTEKNLSLGVNRYADGVSSTHDPDSKESKSSRSKDRRRRGKDPLKEILKGGKKVKSTTATPIKQLFTRKPVLDDLNNIPAPSTPASSNRNSTPNSPSRGSVDSRTTPEVSPNTASNILDLPRPHQRPRDRSASSASISDHHVLNPSQSSSSSSSSIEDNTSISDEQNPNILSRQTRETRLADPTLCIFSTIIQNTDDFSEIVNHSLPSSASSATNTTTTSCVITPATSPSLSSTSSKLVPAPPNTDCGPRNNPLSADLSHALGAADTESGNISRNQYPSSNQTPPKSKSKPKTSAPNPWDWGNTGEVSPSSSSFSVSVIASGPTSSLIAAPAFSPDTLYRKPPRLQPKSLWSKKAKNGASSFIPGSVSHPSLLSPTSGSFVPSDSALLSPSISLSLEKLPNRVGSKDKGGESESEEEPADDSYTQLEFPTLNPTVSSSSSLASSTANSSAGPSNIHRPTTPRRAHSSRGPPTPPGSTPPPSSNSGSGSAQPSSTPAVSTQTQLASLRGALEAARLREEKNKAELERYIKELEAMRWENANSKRGEVELQNYIRHLMHQIQIYSSLFASLAPQPASQQQLPQQTQGPMADGAGLQNPGDRATSGPGPGNGPTTTPSSCTQNIQNPVIPGLPVSSPPMHPHMLPPLQLNGLFSPSSVHAPSPYIPYPIPLPSHPHSVMPSPHPLFAQQFHHMQQQFLQFQQYQQHQAHMGQSPIFQAQQGNPFSTMHQPSLANIPYSASSSSMASGSRSSSRPGTESAGSSPDLNGSLSPGSGSNRKATRTTQIANGYVGVRARGKGTGDNWLVGGGIDEGHEDEGIHESEVQEESGDGDEDEGGFNEILADAILKRPDSIGVRSGKKSKQILLEKEMEEGKDKDREQEHNVLDVVEPLTEFKFPSLSDLGNVYYGGIQSSSSSSVVVSPAPNDPGPNVLDLPAPVDRPSQDLVDVEAIVPQNRLGQDNRNENKNKNQPTAGSSSESERTPRREELESNITELLMDSHGTEEAANVEGQ